MNLSELIADLNNAKVRGPIDIDITGIAYDSRQVEMGNIFVCICGFKTDGHEYIQDAVKKGAAAVLVQKDIPYHEGITFVKVDDTRKALAIISAAYFGYPSKKLKLIGVTGTNGKTTTTYMIKSILEQQGYKVGLIGTISNIIGDKKIESKRTTPESYDLQKMFYKMAGLHTDYCVMEVSSHSLALERVYGCFFNVGIFTNLTRDHLDFHKTFENYLNAKVKLFNQSKIAAVNIDDNYSDDVIKKIKIPVASYSVNNKADVTACDIEITSTFSIFKINYKEESIKVNLPLPGRFNVYNALAAASACIYEGVPLSTIKKGLESIKGIPGRSEVIKSDKGFTVIIDYAHTPDGLLNILNTVKEYVKGHIITVFGCGGDRDKTKRPIMGEIAGRLSDFCMVTSDNPRSEDPDAIIDDILPGIKKATHDYKVIADRKEAIKEAIGLAKADDVVVIAGKGHETYQILKDKTIHFDEREIVRDILKSAN